MSSGSSSDSRPHRLVYVGDPDRTQAASSPSPVGNAISTTKYNVLTFLPRNLFEQFRRVAYVYFLFVGILNQLPWFRTPNSYTALIPLALVLFLTALKDAYEDFQRRKSDAAHNNRPASVLRPDSLSFSPPVKWRHLRPGDVVKVLKDETLPCDLVLLATSDPSGAAFIQTTNLDGESNLKTRYALFQFAGRVPESWADRSAAAPALIKCEPPNLNIYAFHGSIEVDDGRQLSLGPNNLVLRGCELRNTDWVVGVAVYAGMETKVMLNNSGPPSKRSRLETKMNREIVFMAVVMVLMCILATVLSSLWLSDYRNLIDILPFYRSKDFSTGKNYSYNGFSWEVFFTLARMIFLFSNFIPIALYVAMEAARLTQTVYMSRDMSMYHAETDSKLQCRALNINEDLGQIKYLFSDKTGTLTENKMVFRCASVRGVDYSRQEAPVPGEVAPHPTIVSGQVLRPKVVVDVDPSLVRLLETANRTEEEQYAHNFLLALALCNTVVPQLVETTDPNVKLIDYQAESPDEQALTYAAAAFGFVLIERTSGHVDVDVLGERKRYEILGIHEFDSDRKRMSVIVSCPNKSIKLFVKGADISMFSVINTSHDMEVIHATETHLRSYSSTGLRTLVFGVREMTSTEFEEWHLAYEKASTALSGRDNLLRDIALNVERNLSILGASGIEDKLQQGVPEAIESLRTAGIKVWVLTGDKQETAISIGFSCKLLTQDMTQIIINSHSAESAKESLTEAITLSKRLLTKVPLALIIDGPSLTHILKTELEKQLFEVAVVCDVVVCCRVAPLQKAGIVSLVKTRTSELTLSIGDGANDVSMIQMADVGIGISGLEGRQAVMASDFAIAQFRFLVPLLLVHGHWNYQRMSYMILYNIYRNSMPVFNNYLYLFYSLYSLSIPISDLNSVLYLAIYTSIPTVYVGVLDEDLDRETLLKFPQLYGVGQRGESYSTKLFALTFLDSLWQGATLFYVSSLAYEHLVLDFDSFGDVWVFATVLLVCLHLAMDVRTWYFKLHVLMWGSIIATFCIMLVVEQSPQMTGYKAFQHLVSTKVFWLTIICIVTVALLPRFAFKLFLRYLRPDDICIGTEIEKKLTKKATITENSSNLSAQDESASRLVQSSD